MWGQNISYALLYLEWPTCCTQNDQNRAQGHRFLSAMILFGDH